MILLRVENHSPKDTTSCPIRLGVRRSDLHKWHNVHTKYRYYRSIRRTVAPGGHKERFFHNHQLSRPSGRNTGQKLQNCPNLFIYCNRLADDFGLNASNLPFLPKLQRTQAPSTGGVLYKRQPLVIRIYIKHVDVFVSRQDLGMPSTESCNVEVRQRALPAVQARALVTVPKRS